MKVISNGSLHELLQAAENGPFMTAEIYSLTALGNVRVSCNWLYSSLNIEPGNGAEFLWQFNKIDDGHVALSPASSCINQTIFASVRDDIGYYLQVQAPYSADWIRAVGRDETIGLKMHDFTIAELTGFNGSLFTLDSAISSHQNHSGYRIRSIGTTFSKESQWYLKIKETLQADIAFSGSDHSLQGIKNQLSNASINLSDEALATLVKQLN